MDSFLAFFVYFQFDFPKTVILFHTASELTEAAIGRSRNKIYEPFRSFNLLNLEGEYEDMLYEIIKFEIPKYLSNIVSIINMI